MVAPTRTRRYIDPRSHMPPRSMLDNTGGNWLGTSRVVDRPARRKANRRSWAKAKADARRDFIASQTPADVIFDEGRAA